MTSLKSKCNLKGLLEKLNHDELKCFKSLLRLRLESGEYLQEFPWYEVEEANGKKLADILNSNFPGSSLRNVTLHILEKMDLTELSQTLAMYKMCFSDEDSYQESNFLLLNACTGQKEGWRNIIEKLSLVWKNKFCPRDSDHFQDVTQRSQKLIPFLSPQMTTEPTAHTVVLHGPSGVGKTTVAKRCLQDWTEGSQAYRCAFYLSCRELSHMAPCSFVELISKDCPELQDDMVDILAQAQELLFVVDGFDELRVPVQALICDICGDTSKEKPVPILLSSLLKRKIVPNATLLVTTRSRALQELILLVEQPLFIGIQGFLDLDRQAFFRKYFGDEDQALQALVAMKRNEALYSISSAPAVCWVICTCLKLQMERGEDLTLTCQITTSLFLQFLCFQFQPAPDDSPSSHLSAPLEALCLLAAQCLWTQVSVFYEEDLKRLGVKESDLHPFLDKGILQNDNDCMDCYSFMHLSVQQLLAAMFYILKREKKEIQDSFEQDIEDVWKLFSKEARVKNPNLAQVGLFLFGLLNRKRAQEVETTFGCQTSMEVKQELLQAKPGENQPFLHLMDLREVFSCLYESQEEELAEEAMVPFEEMSLQLRNNADLMNSSFCLKHCHNLRRISVQVAKGVFPEDSAALESYLHCLIPSEVNMCSLCRWMDLCSAICSNKNLSLLDISQSFLSSPSVRILCDYVSRVSCCLQKVSQLQISHPKQKSLFKNNYKMGWRLWLKRKSACLANAWSHQKKKKYISEIQARCRWLTPVILASQEAEIRRIVVQSQLGANSL
uniref:NACHT, LRR and PYD domains-containing protein 7 n=1 Tax=Castor canadensis TaxID=51338 RepID=A0A8C0ZLA7_CASCN